MGIFAYHILLEKAECPIIGSSGQACQEGIKVFKDLTPKIVYRTVAFVDYEKVKVFRRQGWIIFDRGILARLPLGGVFLAFFVKFL